MIDNLWFVTLAEAKDQMLKCDAYGYGLDVRRIKKGLKVIDATVQRHKEAYDWWLDMYVYKLLRHEGVHAPLYIIEPRWEQDIAYEFWRYFFSYFWRGAKADPSERKYQE